MEPAETAKPKSREGRSPRDMALSLVVLLVPIVLLLVFYRVVLSGDAPVTVDPAAAIQSARSAGAFPVAVPTGLGDDWHVSSANYRTDAAGATLRLGYVDPEKDPVLLVESNVAADALLRTELGDAAAPRGTVRTADKAWRSYDARKGETALVLTETGRTVVIVGRTGSRGPETLAGSLR